MEGIYLIQDLKLDRVKIDEILDNNPVYVKLAVDIERGILAGGGEFHADCEAILLENGSQQKDIWGADWYPTTQEVGYDSLINIRPSQNNRSMVIQDPFIREKIDKIVRYFLGG